MPASNAAMNPGGHMVMSNGAGQHAAASHGNGAMANGTDPTVVHVNFGLKPRHIYAIIAGIPAGLAALGALGYASLPASKAEVEAVQEGFAGLRDHVTAEIGGLKAVNVEIIGAVRELRDAVAEMRTGRAQGAPRTRPAPRPKPSPPKPVGGLLDF